MPPSQRTLTRERLGRKSEGPHRGILRLFVLHKLSKEPQSGYDLMATLNEITDGAWRPGPGSIYPILRDLEENALVKDHAKKGRSRHVYRLTEKGREELESARSQFDDYSKHGWQRMRGLMLEIMSAKGLAERCVEGPKWQRAMLEKVLSSSEMDVREKGFLLKEVRLSLEKQLDWIDDKLSEMK